jgi:transglutaminase-like putative cysteine protease
VYYLPGKAKRCRPVAFFLFISAAALYLLLPSCRPNPNLAPSISLEHNYAPVQEFIIVNSASAYSFEIEAEDPEGNIDRVLLDGENISNLDIDDDPGSFIGSVSLTPLSAGENETLNVAVYDGEGRSAEVSFVVYFAPDYETGEIVIPEVEIPDGGLVEYLPGTSGSLEEVYYMNPLHTAEESDIRMSLPAHRKLSANRYLFVSGTAVPDDSGYEDRDYHSVYFYVSGGTGKGFTLPVRDDDSFAGYLYFESAGHHTVYAYRTKDDFLYPRSRGTEYSVGEYSSTLSFTVEVLEAVPDDVAYLLPSRDVDCGTGFLRDYAVDLTEGLQDDFEIAQTVFEFLVFGDGNGPFTYNYYDEIFPGFIEDSYSDIFIASHFLIRRRGVCNDFAELYAAMTRSLGFDVKKITGYTTDNVDDEPVDLGHMWVTIKIDETWYRADPTWGNNVPSTADDEEYYKNFAEFYPSFDEEDAATFTEEHDDRFNQFYSEAY